MRSAPRAPSAPRNGCRWLSISPGTTAAPGEIEQLGRRARELADLGVVADRDDHAVADGDRRGGRTGRVEGADGVRRRGPDRSWSCGGSLVARTCSGRRRRSGFQPGRGTLARSSCVYCVLRRVEDLRGRRRARRRARGASRSPASVSCRTTARSWLISTYETPVSSRMSASRLRICAWIETSSAATDSSRISTRGSRRERAGDRDRAGAGRRRAPAGSARAWRASSPTRSQQLACARGRRALPSRVCRRSTSSSDLLRRLARVEARVRVLEDDLDLAAAPAPLARRPRRASSGRGRRRRSCPPSGARGRRSSARSSSCPSRTRRRSPAIRRAGTAKVDVVDGDELAELLAQPVDLERRSSAMAAPLAHRARPRRAARRARTQRTWPSSSASSGGRARAAALLRRARSGRERAARRAPRTRRPGGPGSPPGGAR